MSDLLKALGAKEVKKGEFEFENGSAEFFKQCEGKLIKCTLLHAPDNNGQDREVLVDITLYTDDMPKKLTPMQSDTKAWDE